MVQYVSNMITDFKNKTPFLLGLLFLAFATAHEVEHISEAFEVGGGGFEVSGDQYEESQSQDLVNSETNIAFIDFDIEDSKLVSLTDQSLSKNYHQRAPPKI